MPSYRILGRCGLLLPILCLISASSAQDELQDIQSPNEQEEMLKEMQKVLHGIQSMLDQTNGTLGAENVNLGCRCWGLQCTCCQRIYIRKFRYDSNCCLSIKYLVRNVGFQLALTLGGRTLFRREISLRNPYPICVGAPFLRSAASVCVQLNNIGVSWKSVHACASLSVRVFSFTVARFCLGCYTIHFRRDDMGPASALELASDLYGDWIGTQPDPAVQDDFEEGVAMTENVGGHRLPSRGDVFMTASMKRRQQTSTENGDAVLFANIEDPDIKRDFI